MSDKYSDTSNGHELIWAWSLKLTGELAKAGNLCFSYKFYKKFSSNEANISKSLSNALNDEDKNKNIISR